MSCADEGAADRDSTIDSSVPTVAPPAAAAASMLVPEAEEQSIRPAASKKPVAIKPWRVQRGGSGGGGGGGTTSTTKKKKGLTRLQTLRRTALYEVYVADELIREVQGAATTARVLRRPVTAVAGNAAAGLNEKTSGMEETQTPLSLQQQLAEAAAAAAEAAAPLEVESAVGALGADAASQAHLLEAAAVAVDALRMLATNGERLCAEADLEAARAAAATALARCDRCGAPPTPTGGLGGSSSGGGGGGDGLGGELGDGGATPRCGSEAKRGGTLGVDGGGGDGGPARAGSLDEAMTATTMTTTTAAAAAAAAGTRTRTRATKAGAARKANLGAEWRCRLRAAAPGKYDLVHRVLPGLWCGGWAALNDGCALLKAKGVTHVLSVRSADTARAMPPFVKGSLLVNVEDDEAADLLSHFPAICAFIGQARASPGGSVYVHCGAGISRAPTACAAYLIQSSGGRLPAAAALALVKAHRPCARPNPAFLRQLGEWEKQVVLDTAPSSSSSFLGGSGAASAASFLPLSPPWETNSEELVRKFS